MAISDLVVTDDLTLLLGLIGATIFLLHNLYKPQPLVHPILLGRQSDNSGVRNPGESAIYRNYATGLLGRFPLRPEKDVFRLADLVRGDSDGPRTLWSTKITNPQLKERVKAFGNGLIRIAGLQPRESNVLLLLNDSIEFLISDLALAAHSIPSFTVASAKLLSQVLDAHPPSLIITDAHFLPHLLELVMDSSEASHHTFIVVGEPASLPRAAVSQVKVHKFSDIENAGSKAEIIVSAEPAPNDVFSVAFFAAPSGELQGSQLTHENLTAGVTAIRALVPTTNTISPMDTIISAHSLSTPYGRSIAYAALYEGCSFATLDSSKVWSDNSKSSDELAGALSGKVLPVPPATILFATPGQVGSLVAPVMKLAQKSFLYPFVHRHKLAAVSEGFVTKESLWDRLVFDEARAQVIGEAAGTLRMIVVTGGPMEVSSVVPSKIALSVPIVNAYTHPVSASPILASHPHDFQMFPSSPSAPAHSGAPSVNVEVKLHNINEDAVENGHADPEGDLLVRGPPVGKLIDGEVVARTDGLDEKDRAEGWIKVGGKTRVQKNGSFVVLGA